jgi:hypothetical protein
MSPLTGHGREAVSVLTTVDLCVSGSITTVGIAHAKRPMLIQKGSQMLQLIVIDARVGPVNDTT